jgi:hypothetical protein
VAGNGKSFLIIYFPNFYTEPVEVPIWKAMKLLLICEKILNKGAKMQLKYPL